MKTYMITWKHNSGFQHTPSIVRGNSFPEAMRASFHHDAMAGVMNYEEIVPYFLNVRVSYFQHPLPVTIYYTQHGSGKVYLKWVDGMVDENIRAALKKAATETHQGVQMLVKSFYKHLNGTN